MWSFLRSVLPVDTIRLQAGAASTRLITFSIAGLFGLIALLYMLDAARLALLRTMPGWAASLVVGAGLLLVATVTALIGILIARRKERRARLIALATPAPSMQLAALTTPLVTGILRHPRQLVLLSLVAGAVMELTRKRP